MKKNITIQKYRLRLTTAIPVLIVLILAIAFGVLGYTSARIGEENIHTAVRAFSHPITTASANLLFNPLYSQNVVQMRRILVQYVDGDAIVFAAVYNRDGERVAQVSDKWRPEQSVSAELALTAVTQNMQVEQEIEDYLVLSSPIAAGNQVIGAVEFAFDQNIIRASYLETQQQLFVFMLFTLLATALLFFFLIRFALTPLSNLATAAQKIGEGNLDTHVPVKGAYEIALLAESLEAMRADLLKGYNELQDVLSGLEQRVQDRTAVAETARAEAETARTGLEAQVWLANGQTQLADAIRGEQDIAQLAESVISQICQYTGAQAGALYLLKEKTLTLAGRYALSDRPGFSGKFQLGEGLAGQAAADGKVMVLDDIPSDTVTISTGLVDANPRQITAAPFRANGAVVGVIELATLSAFLPVHLELWNRTSESIGVAFRTAQTRQRLADSLMESQAQSEELQAQEEELRAANEELHAQAENLKSARKFGVQMGEA